MKPLIPIVWKPGQYGGYVAEAGDDVYLDVSASQGNVKWQVGDRCSNFYIDADTDSVEKAKQLAVRALEVITKVDDQYTLKSKFLTRAQAIAWVEEQ